MLTDNFLSATMQEQQHVYWEEDATERSSPAMQHHHWPCASPAQHILHCEARLYFRTHTDAFILHL